jgi:hypothetical protein
VKRRSLAVTVLALVSCRATPSEPPPPSAKLDILPAPPRARGAAAGGTDAAPKPEMLPAPDTAGDEGAPAPSPPERMLPAPDGSAPPPTPPDAGTAL